MNKHQGPGPQVSYTPSHQATYPARCFDWDDQAVPLSIVYVTPYPHNPTVIKTHLGYFQCCGLDYSRTSLFYVRATFAEPSQPASPTPEAT